MDTKLATIPSRPGVYLLKGIKEKILYVGKAKNLKNRIKTYFQKPSHLDARKAKMAKMIKDYSYIVTSNELEALILESTLIKQHKPKFNIILRDDKNYPYIRLTITEKWPRIEVVRKIKKDGNLYFGPYIPAQGMWEVIDFIRRNFLLRTCGHSLDKKIRPCVQYQMKKCIAPCNSKIDRDEYLRIVEDVRLFLAGEKKELLLKLQGKMLELSEQMRFEEAAKIRDKIINIQKAFESQKMISMELGDLDVIGYFKEADNIVVQVLFVRNGVLVGAKEFYLENLMTDDEHELMHSFISLFYSKDTFIPPVILTNCIPEDIESLIIWIKNKGNENITIEVPHEGKKLELLMMANENAKLLNDSRKKHSFTETIERMKEMLKLKNTPSSIGAFDVSTIQGNESVGAYVFWEKGEFKKENYRHFKIREGKGIDDYGMMREIIERAFKDFSSELPSLIMIDGGKAQLSVAKKVIDNLNINCEIIALAKNPDRVFLLDEDIIPLDDKSTASSILKRIRDEVHRFAISYHRKLRNRRLMDSLLDNIKGIGKKRRLLLLRHFGSIDNIRMSSIEDITKIKGFDSKMAGKILEALKNRTF